MSCTFLELKLLGQGLWAFKVWKATKLFLRKTVPVHSLTKSHPIVWLVFLRLIFKYSFLSEYHLCYVPLVFIYRTFFLCIWVVFILEELRKGSVLYLDRLLVSLQRIWSTNLCFSALIDFPYSLISNQLMDVFRMYLKY